MTIYAYSQLKMMHCFNFLNSCRRRLHPGSGPGRLAVLVGVLIVATGTGVAGQGMPPEARENIHTLFDHHTQLHRELILTEDGYEAVTESTNKMVAAALQQHVNQMKNRLDSGLAARRWDPAFAEYRAHYHDISLTIENTDHGVKIKARGATPEAVKVARNHAAVINDFVETGWEAHGDLHPPALTTDDSMPASDTRCRGKGFRRGKQGAGCPSACGRGRCQKSEEPETDMKGTKS